MRRRTLKIFAVVLTAAMMVCQPGLAAGAASLAPAGEGTVSDALSVTEGSAAEDLPEGSGPDTAAPTESGAPGTPELDTQPEASQSENGGDPSGDAVLPGPEATQEPEKDTAQGGPDALEEPSFEGQIITTPPRASLPRPV